jgi:hypothetical protein
MEQTLIAIGVNTPTRRFVFFGGVALVAFYLIKPEGMFTDGISRPWSLFGGGGDADEGGIPSTPMPWWLCVVLIGAFFALFL